MNHKEYKNLVLIGNGFDRWQGLPTSYDQFRLYYHEHLNEAMDKLGLPYETITDKDGKEVRVTPADLIYGDIFRPNALPDEFFWTFETSLDKIDDQQILLYFGRKKENLERMSRMVDDAQALLRTLFCDWIQSLDISPQEGGPALPENSFFINFNYTDTLEKRFGIPAEDIYHIHGDAGHPDSIVVGHATHPEKAFSELTEHHFMKALQPDGLPRFDGLYVIEDMLYRTDKHVLDRIDGMCAAMLRRGVRIEDIENVYVLGHSFGDPDLEYFQFLDKVTRVGCDYEAMSPAAEIEGSWTVHRLMSGVEDEADDTLMKLIQLNIEYAVHHRDRTFDRPSLFPELDELDRQTNRELYGRDEFYDENVAKAAQGAVRLRFDFEQTGRTYELVETLAKELGLGGVPEGCHSVFGLAEYLDFWYEPRLRNANWHISYFSPEDKKRIERVMRDLRLKRYTLYPTIPDCVARRKTR